MPNPSSPKIDGCPPVISGQPGEAGPKPDRTANHKENNGADQDQPVLARCPDCQKNGGCILGIRAAFKIPKTRCPATGLPRTKIYEATSPKPENNFNPPVESYELKKEGAKTGHRIVLGRSYCRYIRSHKTQPNAKFQNQLPKSLRKRTRKKGTVEAPAAAPPATGAAAAQPGAAEGPAVPPTSAEVPTAPVGFTNNPPPPPPPTEADNSANPEAGA